MAFKFDDSYLGAAMAFGKKAKDAKAAGNEEEAQAMMANKASSMVGGALTAVNGVTGMLNTALQSAGIQDTSQYTNQIDTLEQAGNHNYYDYGQLARDISNTDFSVNTDYDAIRGMGGKGVTKEKVGAVASSTMNGAMTGLQVGGPWGALAGAVIGAGSSIGGILAGDAKARVQQGYLDANADRATNLAMLNFNAGLEDISDRRNRFNLVNYAAKGGKIEIKKENEGKFTAAAKRHNMTVQEFAKHVLAKKNAGKYSSTMRKRANFARNAAGWKHAGGGPIDYSGITTTNNRPYNTEYISYIDSALRNGGLNDYQRAAVLANIIEESGGNPFAEGPGGFYGLLQWSGARYPKTQEKDIYKEIDNQVANILSTATNKTDRMSWTHGGKGSGYNSLSEAMDAYNGKNLADVMKGYTLGYVRPAAGINAYNNRLKVAEQLYNLEGFTQHAEGGELNTSNMNTYNTHGGYFNPGLISIDAGGTHEQNPNGGVQMGVDSQGIPNLVEEGETVYDDYVFSDRLKPTEYELKKFNLPVKYAGKTFAEISDLLAEEAKTRPNDAISNNGLGVMLDRLIACQEAHKQAQEERAMKRELSKMSPEELVALGAQLQQMSDQQAMAQQGMQQYMPQMEAPMLQQMPVDDQSQMMMPEQQPMMANGGLLHVYKDGTSKLDKKRQKLFDSVTDALITEANNRDSNKSALTGLPHEEPLKDEYPLMDAAIMAAQPGSIATKVMAPSVYKGILGDVASGDGAQALVQGLVPEGNIFKQLKTNKAVFNRKVVDDIKKEKDLADKYIKSHPSSADWVYYKNATTLEPGFYGGGLEGLEVDYPGITKYVTTNILNGYKDGGGLLNVYKNGTDDKDNSEAKVGYPRYDYGFDLPLPMRNYRVYRHWYPSYAQDFSSLGNIDIPSFNVDLGPTYDYGAGFIQENPYRIGYSNYHVYRTNNTGQAPTPVTVPETGTAAPKTTPVAGRSKTPVSATTASTSTPAGRPSLGLPSVEPITSEAVNTSARLRRKGLGLPDVGSAALEERMPGNLTYGIQPGETPDTASLEGTRPNSVTRQNFGTLLPTMGRYAGAAGNALSALGIALQEPDKVHWNKIQPNYVAGNLDLQKMRYTPLDFMIAGNQMAANSAAMWRAMQNANLGPGAPASFLAKNYADNIAMGNNFNNTQLANDQRRAQTIGVNNQAENMMRNFDFRRNAMNTGIANQFAQYNNQLDMDETLRNIQFENDKYAALSHAISNSLADISNIGRENFVMNQINSNAALYYGVGANGWAYYKGYDGMDWKIDPNTGRKTPVVDKSEIPAQQQKCGGKLKK